VFVGAQKERECADFTGSYISLYHVYIKSETEMPSFVWCDMETAGGGWTVCITPVYCMQMKAVSPLRTVWLALFFAMFASTTL